MAWISYSPCPLTPNILLSVETYYDWRKSKVAASLVVVTVYMQRIPCSHLKPDYYRLICHLPRAWVTEALEASFAKKSGQAA